MIVCSEGSGLGGLSASPCSFEFLLQSSALWGHPPTAHLRRVSRKSLELPSRTRTRSVLAHLVQWLDALADPRDLNTRTVRSFLTSSTLNAAAVCKASGAQRQREAWSLHPNMVGVLSRRRPAPRERHLQQLRRFSIAGRGPFHHLPGALPTWIREIKFFKEAGPGGMRNSGAVCRLAASRIRALGRWKFCATHTSLSSFAASSNRGHCARLCRRRSHRDSAHRISQSVERRSGATASVRARYRWPECQGRTARTDLRRRSGGELAAARRSIRHSSPGATTQAPGAFGFVASVETKAAETPFEVPR